MKKVLVTGAAGFVGKAIVDELQSKGFDLHTCGRRPNADLPNYHSADIASTEDVRRLQDALSSIDAVIHSAGLAHQFQAPPDQSGFHRVNVEGSRNIAKLAVSLGCKRFVLVSSISVYGDGKPNPCHEDAPREPAGPYAVSKYEAEKVVTEVCEKNGIDLVIIRLATVYGKNDVGNVLRLIKLIDSGKFFWSGDGSNGKSLINNVDAATGIVMAMQKAPSGTSVYNLTDVPHTMKEIVDTIATKLGKKIPGIKVPTAPIDLALKVMSVLPVIGRRSRSLSDSLKKWRSDDVLSGDKIKREIGFEPSISLAEGIAREIAWYRRESK